VQRKLYLGRPGVTPVNRFPPAFDASGAAEAKAAFSSFDLRVGAGSLTQHLANKERIRTLPVRDWPRYRGRSLWPSCPNILEMLCEIDQGFIYPQISPGALTVRVPRTEFQVNPEMAKLIIRRQVIGVRSDIALPNGYREYFRYRWNFLILTAPRIPIGLARFLAGLWLTKPSSLWLERKESLKKFLRKVPVGICNDARDRFSSLDCYNQVDSETESEFSYSDESNY